MDDTSKLTQLGSNETRYQFEEPCTAMLETFPAPIKAVSVLYETQEFSSLCPKTHQPDFASICIQYDPDELCVETKSLKLYLFAYRNHGSFMESITRKICDDFVEACDPLYCKVTGEFAARGGIAITVVAEHSKER